MRTARLGSISTGLIVGYLTMYFVSRLPEYTVAGLGTVVGLLAGGVIAGLIGRFAEDKQAFGYYPIGLVLGAIAWGAMWFVVYVWAGIMPANAPESSSPPAGSGTVPILEIVVVCLGCVILALWSIRRRSVGPTTG